MTGRTAFVIGGAGFIGSHVVRVLVDQGWFVVAIDRIPEVSVDERIHRITVKLPDDAFVAALTKYQPAALIFAAGTPLVRESFIDPYADFESSTVHYFWVLEQIRQHSSTTRVVFLSSAAVYGNSNAVPIKESSSLNPITPYGFHKLLCESVSREFIGLYGMQITIFRIFSVFGPGLRRQVVWDIVKKALASSDEIMLMGTGQETRDFIPVEELAMTIVNAIETDDLSHYLLNLGSGQEISIKDIARKIVAQLQSDKPIRFSSLSDQGMPLRWQADIECLKNAGILAPFDFESRLAATVAWIRQNG